MTEQLPLILYTREDCHLCELAAAMMGAVGLEWRPVDIDTAEELAARYGLHVPVVARADNGEELFFPFDEDALRRFAEGV